MQIVLLVHVGQPLKRLEHDVSYHLLWEQLPPLPHELVNVQVKIFKDEVEHILLKINFV